MIVPADYACIVLCESNGEFIAMLVNESKILFVSGLSCIYNQCSVQIVLLGLVGTVYINCLMGSCGTPSGFMFSSPMVFEVTN